MAFLEQLSAKFSELSPKINLMVEQANKAKQNLVPVLNKCTRQLDTLGKILQVNAHRQQSPIDLLPSITAFNPDYENATFTYNVVELGWQGPGSLSKSFNYDDAPKVVKNTGQCLQVKYPDGSSVDFTSSLFLGEKFHLETVNIHWGTEPMNGSEHTVGGVGYAGEIHFIYRNLNYLNLDLASKGPNGIIALSVFLNESHDDNTSLISLNNVLSNVHYAGTETVLQTFNLSGLVPSADKLKEFWHYEGSETIDPFRETVKWVIFRAAIPVSSSQLDTWRTLRRTRHENEIEEKMVPLRALQPCNSRIVQSSFKSVAQAELPTVQKNFAGTG